MLNDIWHYVTTEEVTWTQNWEIGGLLIWKNIYVLNEIYAFDPNSRRTIHSLKLKEMTI